MSNYIHDPQSVLDYAVDWAALTNGTGASDWLATGETITASTWTVPSGITQTTPAPSFTDTVATIWLTGGTLDLSYSVTNHITTNQGRQQDRTITLIVRNH